MIAYLRGQIKSKTIIPKKEAVLIVDVNGVGYRVLTLDRIANVSSLGSETELYIYTQVTETAFSLYGFVVQEELDFFSLLLSISGIGPKSALDILNKSKLEDLKQAAQTGNYEILSKVSGIGPKTAEKIVIGLKNKVESISVADSKWSDEFSEALEALIGLGYSAGQVREVLGQCEAVETGDKVMEALKILGNR